MEPRRNGRHGLHASSRQKIKLISFMARHPELISAKITTSFSYADRHRLWQAISDECNALPGAKKHWRQWRKTWQDLRSKYKKQYNGVHERNLPPLLAQLSEEERDLLGIKTKSSSQINEESENQSHTEFIPLEREDTPDNTLELKMDMAPSYSDPESPPETKVFTRSHKTKLKNSSSKHTEKCAFNCELLAVHEQKKLEMKQDYINFKKDYLRQKLKLLKEQTEALKSIARELSDK